MEKFLLTGDASVKLAENDGCSVYQFRNETGEGTITIYEVFPGVSLSCNDFHIRYYDSAFNRTGTFSVYSDPEGTGNNMVISY